MYLHCVCTLASKDPTLYILHGSIRGSIKSKYQHGSFRKEILLRVWSLNILYLVSIDGIHYLFVVFESLSVTRTSLMSM